MMVKEAQLNKIRSDAAECLLISSLATSEKKEMFAKIADHLNSLAFEFEKTVVVGAADVTSTKPLQLDKIRSDAAECLSLSQLAKSDKREMFAKTAEHLNSLVFEVEKTIDGANAPTAEHRLAAVTTDLNVANNQVAVTASAATAGCQQAGRRLHRLLPWLLVVATTIAGVLFLASDRSAQNVIVQRLSVFTTLGSLEKVLQDFKRSDIGPTGSSNREFFREEEKTASATRDPVTTRRDLEIKGLSSNGDDEAQLRKAAETAAAELQQERQKTAALTIDLAIARRDLETKAASSNRAGDQTAQLRNTTEASIAELQQVREKNAAPDRNLGAAAKTSTASPTSELSTTSTSKVEPEAAHLLERAKSLLSQGNIIGARIFLERASEMGNARASFAIAETYDPRILSGWNVYGTRGDISKAREFYAKAAAGGIEEAKGRLSSLDK